MVNLQPLPVHMTSEEYLNSYGMPTEFDEQERLIHDLEDYKRKGKILMFTALPNNTYTNSWVQKQRLVRQGQKKGFPDLCIITKTKVVFIEMKRRTGGTVSPEQKAWIEAFQSVNIDACVCKGYEEAKAYIDSLI